MKIFKNVKGFFTSKAWKQADELFEESFERRMREQGHFEYTEKSFQIKNSSGIIEVLWADVNEIRAYKVDLLTVDEIRIDILSETSTITITEETPGYYIFKEKLKAVFPSLDLNWEEKVVKPAFAKNLTVIYKK
ncbi:hypothetical protein [Pontibacter rugosus]|uniref:Uncharacterized protein n=1 Tax=Pontibacter rugosus TaxID=1745966 RepID=A0ABW3SV92_9BACT